MKKTFLLMILFMALSSCSIDIKNSSESNRYQIIDNADGPDMLLDSETGETWIQKDLGSGMDWKYRWIKNVKE